MTRPHFSKIFPWAVVGLAFLYLVWAAVPRRTVIDGFNVDMFGRLPVQDGGRIKPLDTMARVGLYAISGRQTFVDNNDATQPAVKWLLDVITTQPGRGGRALDYKTFRIENTQVLSLLGLQPRAGFRYALSEFKDNWGAFEQEAAKAHNKPADQRDLYDAKLVELHQHVMIFLKLANFAEPRYLPPLVSGDPNWMTMANASGERGIGRPSHLLAEQLEEVLDAYASGDARRFNDNLVRYSESLEKLAPATFPRAEFEVLFNRIAPFYQCMILSVVVLVLGCASWLGYTQPLRRAAFWLAILTFLVHTWALIGRMYLTGRPAPVTSLYSSAIFIGWGCTGLCLLLEWIFCNGVAIVVAAVTAFISLFISHNLISGDTMEMLQAVLDTNFWLATHVVCVTFGYTATFVAGFLGAALIILGINTTVLQPKNAFADMAKMIYGVVCFGTFLSFTGTVLGGLWADYSWGRFWGWDPKENGALLIVIWNALVLHARWAGMIKQRGLAVLAVGGNIVTSWSWFGTNMLGVGLHSYGFMEGVKWTLIAFDILMLGVILLGALIPTKNWLSCQPLRLSVPGPTPGAKMPARLTPLS